MSPAELRGDISDAVVNEVSTYDKANQKVISK